MPTCKNTTTYHPKVKEFVPQESSSSRAVPSTNHAITWKSSFTQRIETPEDLKLLSHVNCSYLSGDQAPTLLELKKHAQSLAILIRKLSVESKFGVPDAEAVDKTGNKVGHNFIFKHNDAFDWLNDLSKPYENSDAVHYLPLNSLRNEVESEGDVEGVQFHCPLPHKNSGHGSHAALVQHANECLEILDHEHSATGGLLSILPSEDADSEEMKNARNTLLGQWLLFQHHLMGRMHELEIEYANACSSLSWEAEIPKQIISRQTFEERTKGHDVAHLQDSFILVNAGSPAHRDIHKLLDEEETKMEERARQWYDAGTIGARMFEEAGDNDDEPLAAGLVQVDLVSRFYRVKGDGPDAAVYILPAIQHQDSVKTTLEIERNPGVVTVPTRQWPARVSEWERKYKDKIHQADMNADLRPTVDLLEDENRRLQVEIYKLRAQKAGNYPTWGASGGFGGPSRT